MSEQQQQQRRRRSSSPQEVVGVEQAGVRIDPEEEAQELWGGYGEHGTLKLTSLVLSTTAYRTSTAVPPSSENNHDDEGDKDEVECSICLVPFEEGDRIGKLPCRHPMHVECLKPWLQRQNACPLCKQQRVAHPKYTKENDEPTKERMNDMPNSRRIEGSISSDELLQEANEAIDAGVQGSETMDPIIQVEDEQSNHLEGTIAPRNSEEVPLEPEQDDRHDTSP